MFVSTVYPVKMENSHVNPACEETVNRRWTPKKALFIKTIQIRRRNRREFDCDELSFGQELEMKVWATILSFTATPVT